MQAAQEGVAASQRILRWRHLVQATRRRRICLRRWGWLTDVFAGIVDCVVSLGGGESRSRDCRAARTDGVPQTEIAGFGNSGLACGAVEKTLTFDKTLEKGAAGSSVTVTRNRHLRCSRLPTSRAWGFFLASAILRLPGVWPRPRFLPFFRTLGEPTVTCCYPTLAGHLPPDRRHALLLLSPRESPHALTP